MVNHRLLVVIIFFNGGFYVKTREARGTITACGDSGVNFSDHGVALGLLYFILTSSFILVDIVSLLRYTFLFCINLFTQLVGYQLLKFYGFNKCRCKRLTIRHQISGFKVWLRSFKYLRVFITFYWAAFTVTQREQEDFKVPYEGAPLRDLRLLVLIRED